MKRIKSSELMDEILSHISFISTNHMTSLEFVRFKYPAMPMFEYFGDNKVPFKTFGTVEGISNQIDSFECEIGLVYCFTGYVSATGAYIITAFPVEINNEVR